MAASSPADVGCHIKPRPCLFVATGVVAGLSHGSFKIKTHRHHCTKIDSLTRLILLSKISLPRARALCMMSLSCHSAAALHKMAAHLIWPLLSRVRLSFASFGLCHVVILVSIQESFPDCALPLISTTNSHRVAHSLA